MWVPNKNKGKPKMRAIGVNIRQPLTSRRLEPVYYAVNSFSRKLSLKVVFLS